MTNYRIVSIATGEVARINRQGHFQQVTTHRVHEAASGSIDEFQRGRERGSLVLTRNTRDRTAHLQLSVLSPSGSRERCNLGTSGHHSEWVNVPSHAGVTALFEGDYNHDGRRDYLVLFTNGAAVLLERDSRPRVCGFFGPPGGDLD